MMLLLHQIILNILERIFGTEYKITIAINNLILTNLKCDINKKDVKKSALSSDRIDKYEYITGKEILLSNQNRIIEQTKFTYFPLGKALEKQTKTIEDQGEKQIKAIESRVEKQLLDTDQKSIASLLKKIITEDIIFNLNKIV